MLISHDYCFPELWLEPVERKQPRKRNSRDSLDLCSLCGLSSRIPVFDSGVIFRPLDVPDEREGTG
jgi:hypothetical protein